MTTRFLVLALLTIATLPVFGAVSHTLLHTIPAPPVGVQAGAKFGTNVAVDGNYTMVGAPFDDTGTVDAGVVKVFNTTTGVLLFVLPNPSPEPGDLFGGSVAISGPRVVVGTPNDSRYAYPQWGGQGEGRGRVFVFDLSGVNPAVPVATVINPIGSGMVTTTFGSSVAISGTRMAVSLMIAHQRDEGGPYGTSMVYLYDLSSSPPGTIYGETALRGPVYYGVNQFSPIDSFGSRLGMSGARLLVEDSRWGIAHVYDISSAIPVAPVVTLSNPGNQAAISGNRVIVKGDSGSAYVYDLNSGTLTVPVFTLNNPAPTAGDSFGDALAISGARVVVGVPGGNTGATNAGSAYIYDLNSLTPSVPVLTLNNLGPASGDTFGFSAAISGTRVVVGAPEDDTGATDTGSVYLFDLSGSTPSVPVLTLNDPGPAGGGHLGASVAISGTRLVAGGDGTRSVQVYETGGLAPTVPVATLSNPNSAGGGGFGLSVAISGARVVVGAPYDDTGASAAGSAYVYDLNGSTPTVPVVTLNNPFPADSDLFGSSVTISESYVVVAAPSDDTTAANSGTVYVYDLNHTTPTVPVAILNNPSPAVGDKFGFSVGISGSQVVVGSPYDDTGAVDTGSAYVFDLNGATPLVPVTTLHNPSPLHGDNFGFSVAISGTRTAVGAPNHVTDIGDSESDGVVCVYDLSGATPAVPMATFVNPGWEDFWSDTGGSPRGYGTSVAISGTRVAVGAYLFGALGLQWGYANVGRTYVYDLSSATPSALLATLINPSPAQGDHFGYSVAIDSTTIAIGTPYEDTTAFDAGSIYVFKPVPAPEMAVEASGMNISVGGSSDFGVVAAGSTNSVTFIIRNTGDADLTGLVVSKSGANPADYIVGALSNTVVAAAGTATFSVAFTPIGGGLRSAGIHIASNVAGAANPFDITLTGTATIKSPVIHDQPNSVATNRGQQAVFEVAATGWNLSFQWKKGGSSITGATAAAYAIHSTQAADAGSYTVVVSNEGGSVTSDPAILTVYVPSGFTHQPANITATPGQSVTLSPLAEGSGTLTWQWRKDGVDIPGATSANYSISNVQPWHSGNYSAVIGNGTDSATSVAAAMKVVPFPFNVWRGLVAYYPLNAAQTGKDFGPTAQLAFNQGAAAAADSWGRTDGARRFIATESDGMMTASGAFFHSQPSFTWAAWVKTSGTYGSASTRIISTEGPDGSGQAGFGLYANSNGKFGAGLNWGGGAQGFESAAVYPANVWRHLAATYDGSRLRLYVDGAQAGSRLYSGVTLTSDSPLYFGKYRANADGSTGGYFDGWLDEVRFYNRVLTAADLAQLRASDDGMDLDGDGQGDAWEARYGFSAAANDGSGDADGDGMTNREEYLAGSHPLNPASNFHAPQLTEVPGLNVLNLTWHGSPARNYAVQTSPDLTTWQTLSTLPGLTGPTSLVVEAPLRPVRRYYKVVVVP